MLDTNKSDFSDMSLGELIEEIIDSFHEGEQEWDITKHKVNKSAWLRIRKHMAAICKANKAMKKQMLFLEKILKQNKKREEKDEAFIFDARIGDSGGSSVKSK